MNTKTLTRNTSQRGYTLAEILVAVAIFAVIILGALLLYDRSNQVFKQSVESSDMQQSTRVAFDKLAADLRMAGFDYDRDGTPFSALASTWKAETAYTAGMLVQPTNPNGHTYVCVSGGTSAKTEPVWPEGDNEQVAESGSTVKWQEQGQLQYQQPDEQIEYAGRSAVVLRANFNYGTATGTCDSTSPCENGREPKLESSEFPIVTTANNEIVAYALKPVKWASGETADDLVFYADVATPRKANPSKDAKESKITITGVDLCDKGCNSPPYTLYRYTLTDAGTPDAGTPVAENIREVRYRYYSTTSAAAADEITTLPNGDGQYDGANPDATLAGRDARSSIRSVELTLVGMNPQPDYQYTNPTDTIAKNYRTLELKSLITPRNAGRRGMKEYNTDAPGEPEIKSVCAGACNAIFLTWSPPSVGGDIESYAILYDTDKCTGDEMPAGGYQYSEEVGLNLSGSVGRFIQPNQEYYFAVQAISKWGAKPSKCIGPVKAINKTKPEALKELIATNDLLAAPYNAVANQIDVYFPPAVSNLNGQDQLSCTGGGNLKQDQMPPAEKRYYELWRGKTINFQLGDPGAVRILEAGSTIQPTAVGDYMKFSDLTAASCTEYYYRIRVVDYCQRNPTWNESGSVAQGESEWYPLLTDNAVLGKATANAKPKKPVITLAKADCSGASGNCKLTFTWGAVNQNEKDEPIYVDKYILRVYKSADGTTFPATATDTKNITGGLLTTEYEVKSTDLTQFRLVAVDCQESEASDPIVYPCVFNAGTLVAGVSGGAYGGSGASGDPFIIENATLTADTTSNVSEFRMTIFDATDGSTFATATAAGTAKTASFAIPNTPDGRLMRVQVTAVDDKGCTKNTEVYVIDTAAPACSITDSGSDATIVTINKDNVVFRLKNTSTNDLILKKVVVKFNAATGDQLLSVGFNGTTVNTGCTKTTVVVTAPANTKILKSSTSFLLQLNYKDNNLQGANPTTSLCLIYQTPNGDILSCQMHPGAATCTEPAATCQ
ncbi:MAG TPA: prepilin-type N-terminal cleavage/methylation domain-containing protein [Thermoanaerobaculia bacterium]